MAASSHDLSHLVSEYNKLVEATKQYLYLTFSMRDVDIYINPVDLSSLLHQTITKYIYYASSPF